MSRWMLLCLFCCLSLGCGIVSDRLQAPLAPAAGMGGGVRCAAPCQAEWTRAQLWLVNHAQWKLQLVNDVLLQTYNPTTGDPTYGFTVTKEPQSDGSGMIRMTVFCGNLYGCDPKPPDVGKAFYYYVSTGVDLLLGLGYLSAIR